MNISSKPIKLFSKIKKMKNTFLFLVCLLYAILSFSQAKIVIINQTLDQVTAKFSEYKNYLGSYDIMAGTDEAIQTTFKIKYEDYFKDAGEKYLKLAYTDKPSSSSLVDSNWDISFKKTKDDKVEFTIALNKIMPRAGLKSNIIIAESYSTGKLEKEIIDFIESDKTQSTSSYEQEEQTENEITQATNNIAFDSFKTLLNEKKVVSLPNTLIQFKEKIGSNPNVLSNEACENDEYYSWGFSNGVNLIYYKLKNQNQAYSLSYFGDSAIAGLPLDLVFKQTTFQECKIKYARYAAKWHQESETDPNTNASHTFLVLEFKMDQYFVTLGFYDNNYLSSIQLSTSK
jgi:hypothetical protein